jgi:hypothetical protein
VLAHLGTLSPTIINNIGKNIITAHHRDQPSSSTSSSPISNHLSSITPVIVINHHQQHNRTSSCSIMKNHRTSPGIMKNIMTWNIIEQLQASSRTSSHIIELPEASSSPSITTNNIKNISKHDQEHYPTSSFTIIYIIIFNNIMGQHLDSPRRKVSGNKNIAGPRKNSTTALSVQLQFQEHLLRCPRPEHDPSSV